MINLTSIATISGETAFTFAVKNSVCFMALDNVRTSLQQTITEIVMPKLGGFFAPLVGMQLGTMCAVPVTLMLGDLAATALKEAARSIHSLFRAIVYGEKNEHATPFIRELIINVASFAIGFFAKTYFCNYCMTYVSRVLRIGIFIGAPLIGASLAISLMAPAMVVMAAPTVTFMLGDIVGDVASTASNYTLTKCCSFVLDG